MTTTKKLKKNLFKFDPFKTCLVWDLVQIAEFCEKNYSQKMEEQNISKAKMRMYQQLMW